MSQKYKITDDEINQTILHSPYSLSDSPVRSGLKALQIKKYFYEFIRFFAEKINLHLSEIEKAFEATDKKLQELNEKDNSLGNAIVSKINTHNSASNAHSTLLKSTINEHDTSNSAHRDIRLLMQYYEDKLNVAYALASGKQMVYPCQSVVEALEQIGVRPNIKVGDLFLVADDGQIDFTVFEVGQKAPFPDDIAITYNEVANGEITLVAGKIYYFNGYRLLASTGTLETGLLAKQEELDELESAFWENANNVKSMLIELEGAKENVITRETATGTQLTLESHKEYNFGIATELKIVLPSDTSELEAIINFRSASTPTSFDAPSKIIFKGDDTIGGRLYPVANRLYEVNIKSVTGVLVARVGACDYEVIK